MKKLFLYLCITVMAMPVFAQIHPIFGEHVMNYEDKPFEYKVMVLDQQDQYFNQAEQYLGKPTLNTPIKKEWQHISIPSLGSDLVLTLIDGYLHRPSSGYSCSQGFKDEQSKNDILSKIDNTEYYRYMTIVLTDADGNNVVNTTDEFKTLKHFLEEKNK